MTSLLIGFRTTVELEEAQNNIEGFGLPIKRVSPIKIEKWVNELEQKKPLDVVKFTAFAGGVIGLIVGFGFQWYASAIQTPIAVGGRPLFSWPAFIPVTFVLTILFAAIAGVTAFLLHLKLPEPSHPLFGADYYDLNKNLFYLWIESPGEDKIGLIEDKLVALPHAFLERVRL